MAVGVCFSYVESEEARRMVGESWKLASGIAGGGEFEDRTVPIAVYIQRNVGSEV
jgi:hypothetical protein